MVKAKIEIQAESKLPMPPSKSDDLGYDLVCAVLATRVLVSPAKHYQVGTMWSGVFMGFFWQLWVPSIAAGYLVNRS